MPLRGEAAINTGVKIGLLVDAGDKSCSETSPLAIVTYNMGYSPVKNSTQRHSWRLKHLLKPSIITRGQTNRH